MMAKMQFRPITIGYLTPSPWRPSSETGSLRRFLYLTLIEAAARLERAWA
jgi:hypothetical protein